MSHLSDLLPSNSLVIPGSSGACSEVTMQAFKCKKGTRVYNSEGLGSMGFGIPAAIGGCLASDRRETICIIPKGKIIPALAHDKFCLKIFVRQYRIFAY